MHTAPSPRATVIPLPSKYTCSYCSASGSGFIPHSTHICSCAATETPPHTHLQLRCYREGEWQLQPSSPPPPHTHTPAAALLLRGLVEAAPSVTS